VKPEETLGKSLYALGNRQWDIPKLHELLETVLPADRAFENFEVRHDFPGIGQRTMLLNAHRVVSGPGGTQHILLAMEDITVHRKANAERGSPGRDPEGPAGSP